MIRRVRDLVVLAAAAVVASLFFAIPAGAQQLVDAGKEHGGGPLAFVLFTALVGLTFAVLFAMDRIRRRRQEEQERETQR
jgi:membrane protein implicated in regulation of membrane protease activity